MVVKKQKTLIYHDWHFGAENVKLKNIQGAEIYSGMKYQVDIELYFYTSDYTAAGCRIHTPD